MKIGLISDIHGSLSGLQKALDLLRDLGADRILCAGDLVDGDANDDDVVKLIIEQDIPSVQGNHDHAARATQLWRMKNLASDHPYLLKQATVDFVDALPVSRRFEWEGVRVLLAHCNPWDQITYIYPNGKPGLIQRVMEVADADVVILGHTHIPMSVHIGRVWIYNPGSVWWGRYDNRSTCAVLTLPSLDYTVYDIDTRASIPYQHTAY